MEMSQPLSGIRVLDLTRLVAGGMLGMLLGDFGADVIKVEQPGKGDPLREWKINGQSLWWRVYSRNKRSITLNLKHEESRDLFKALVQRSDILCENFVPGTMERFGFSWDVLHHWNPKLIFVRISGWGQTGSKARNPGFGTLIEAASGFAMMNGEADGAPIVPPFPLADMVTALTAGNAAMFALHHRDKVSGKGQQIDISLFESLFTLLGPMAAEYEAFKKIRVRQGSKSHNAAPRGTYQTKDGHWLSISASTPVMANRLLNGYNLGYLLDDPRFATNQTRVDNQIELDKYLIDAISSKTLEENLRIIEKNKITAVQVQSIADIEQDPHWMNRNLIVDVSDDQGKLRMQNVFPHFSATPGNIRWPGKALGADNIQVYCRELGISNHHFECLKSEGVV
jgi:crotonobetainyl-CoA:carnitine CoA-transferase CaiB-like acyl-CoA transferase